MKNVNVTGPAFDNILRQGSHILRLQRNIRRSRKTVQLYLGER